MLTFLDSWSEKKKRIWTNVAAIILLSVMFLLAFFSSKGILGDPGDSGTVDEIAHIPSGYTYVKDNDFRLNPEHPPLAKALAGLSLVLKGFRGPEADWSWSGINQWEAGWYMLYEAGNDPANLLIWARVPMILLMLLLGYFIFKWAKELYGRKVGLLVLLLFAFYPDVLAHGRLVTTDIAAALGFVITMYYFDKMIENRTSMSIALASVAFALAQLLKFSSFLLFGILLILIVIRAYQERQDGLWPKFMAYFKDYLLVCVLSLLLVWLVYIPFVWQTPVSVEHEVIERNLTSDPATLIFRNFLHLFEGNVAARALGHYFLGIFLVVARVGGGNATFALNNVAEKSISWFFPFAWLVKTPITIILLVLASLFVVIKNRFKFNDKGSWKMWLILMPIIVYWAFTLKGSLNIGIRHLMPTIPFVLLLIGWLMNRMIKAKKPAGVYIGILSALIVFMMYHTLSYFPQYISYFNNFVPRDQRYKYLVDSSLDWGQDLLRLKNYIKDNDIKDIKIDYFGGSVPSYYIREASEWHSSYGPTTGWLAVSSTYYQSSKLYGPKEKKWSYEWLDNFTPEAVVGGSILVYNITPQDLAKYPPKSSYRIEKIDPVGSLDIEKKKVGL